MSYVILALAFLIFLMMGWALDLSKHPACRPESDDHTDPDHT